MVFASGGAIGLHIPIGVGFDYQLERGIAIGTLPNLIGWFAKQRMNKAELAESIIRKLQRSGHEAYLAGGCVRDRLRGSVPKDFDIATSALPEKVQSLFKKTIPVGVQFGVVIVVEESTPFEVATFRTESKYLDGRRPSEVSFATVEEDSKRRDFTVNGLYFDVESKKILDFVEGARDIKAKIIRTIGDPKQRFAEDHLRLMRAVRFAVQLGFQIEDRTWRAVCEMAPLIAGVSIERIRDEFSKILTSEDPERGILLLDEAKLLQVFLPEVELLKGVEQPMEHHPEGDVFVHTLLLMKGLKHAPLELAMGALLHDIAKPQTFVRAPDRIRFHGHDTIGAEESVKICKRLSFSNGQTVLIRELVAQHLRFKDAFQMKQSTLKRFLSLPRFDLHLELHRLDCLASHKKLEAYHFTKQKWTEFQQLPPPSLKLVTGGDLIKLGFKPGPEFSKMLRFVEDAILEGTVKSRAEGVALLKKQFMGGEKKSALKIGDPKEKVPRKVTASKAKLSNKRLQKIEKTNGKLKSKKTQAKKRLGKRK